MNELAIERTVDGTSLRAKFGVTEGTCERRIIAYLTDRPGE